MLRTDRSGRILLAVEGLSLGTNASDQAVAGVCAVTVRVVSLTDRLNGHKTEIRNGRHDSLFGCLTVIVNNGKFSLCRHTSPTKLLAGLVRVACASN